MSDNLQNTKTASQVNNHLKKKKKRGKKKQKYTSSNKALNSSFGSDHSEGAFDLEFGDSVSEDHQQPLFGCSFNRYFNTKNSQMHSFANVGSNRASIYHCLPDGKLKSVRSFVDPCKDESFYAWLYLTSSRTHLLAVGGLRGVIQLIDVKMSQSFAALIGHGHSVNDLLTHPLDSNLLLSGSKDHSVRLWNAKTQQCIAIFCGYDGHQDEVLSIDFDLRGERIVSSGIDHQIKIWQLATNEKITECVQLSYTFYQDHDNKNNVFPTVIVHYPEYSTSSKHSNYVDCVKFFGDLIASKSCEGFMKLWRPCEIEPGKKDFMLNLAVSDLKDVWFLKMAIDPHYRLLAVSNIVGKVFLWDLSDTNDIIGKAVATIAMNVRCKATVRQVVFSPDSRIMIAVCHDATVWRWNVIDIAAAAAAEAEIKK